MPGFLFPLDTEYDRLIAPAALAASVSPSLVKGLIAAESSFSPASLRWEPSGAATRQQSDTDASYGLMQVTHGATKRLGYVGDPAALMDPATNVQYGVKYFALLLNRPYMNVKPGATPRPVNRPVVEQAIAAYNMGYPRAIESTTDRIARHYSYPMGYKDAPPPGWAFANQPYVDRVRMYAAMYEAAAQGQWQEAERLKAALKKKRFSPGIGAGVGGLALATALGLWALLRRR